MKLGFRYFIGPDTSNERNKYTGQANVDGELKYFETKEELKDWLDDEKRDEPWEYGGGKRIAVTKKELKVLAGGATQKEFEEMLKIYKELYECELECEKRRINKDFFGELNAI